jgi:hypothetical protein
VRDVGGINIKEGLVYRGCEINHEYRLTEEGKAIFKDQLGIRTEINLRKEVSFFCKVCNTVYGVFKLPFEFIVTVKLN